MVAERNRRAQLLRLAAGSTTDFEAGLRTAQVCGAQAPRGLKPTLLTTNQ